MNRVSLGLVSAIVLVGATTLSADQRTSAQRPTEPATVTLNPPAAARTTSGATAWPALGDWVTFSATYPRQLENKGIRIQVMCYQNGDLVFGMAGPHDYEFLLGGAMSTWYLNGAAASCVADLYYWSYNGGQKFNWLASTTFDAAGR